MGNYNPRAPIILGNEWVPIRSETIELPAQVAPFEVGHRFTLTQSRTLDHASFYVDSFPGNVGVTPQMINVYPAGTESDTGPIQSVIIPVNGAVVTGADISLSGASSYAEALLNPDDAKGVQFLFNPIHTIGQYLTVFFATNQYAQQLNGKRILGVNILYSGIGTISPTEIPASAVISLLWGNLAFTQGVTLGPLPSFAFYPTNATGQVPSPVSRFGTGDFTEFNTSSFTSAILGPVLPWRYADLQRLEQTNANPVGLSFFFGQSVSGDFIKLNYCALEVIYCTEQRVAVGGGFKGPGQGGPSGYNLGANYLQLFTLNGAANPVLSAGDYVVTLTNGDTGNRFDTSFAADVPPVNALRELYAIPPHKGVQINRTLTIGDQWTEEQVHVLPQLSIHVSGGTLTEPHVYGEQVNAPVYTGVSPSQVIYDDVVTTPASFPQVRFYARRFGATQGPLVLSTTSPTISGSSVFISPDDLDALPELIDGWREVTLRFDTPPTMGGITPDPSWVWSSTETAGNRWEVLGAQAPALSGTPGNLLNTVRPIDVLSSATYQPSAGAATALSWLSPSVSAVTLDATADAVLLFSQDPPTVTGLAVSVQSLALTGFGGDCGTAPCCVPTALQYNALTWSTPLPIAADDFQRTTVSGFGGSWAVTGSGAALADYSTDGDEAVIVTNTAGDHIAYLPTVFTDIDVQTRITLDTPKAFTYFLIPRMQDSSNYYCVRISQSITGTRGQLVMRVFKVVGGSNSFISGAGLVQLPFTYVGGEQVRVRAQFIGQTLRAKAWLATDTEPDWMQSVYNESTFTQGFAGFNYSSGVVSTLKISEWLAEPAGLCGSYFQLQRSDSLTDWQTIMQSTRADVLHFNDYEARVGVAASYRIRVVNGLSFNGSWSSTVSATIPAPGVTLPSCGSSGRGLLIFTSNSGQTGQYALAYPPTWESEVAEDFALPEAGTVAFTQQYGRDFQVAFKGTERGGETFQRVLLLANAAVALPRLANVKSLRDLAWADLPYVCVRDDLGDRWLAAVLVPTSNTRRNRQLYNAPITVVEVTQTAAPVAP